MMRTLQRFLLCTAAYSCACAADVPQQAGDEADGPNTEDADEDLDTDTGGDSESSGGAEEPESAVPAGARGSGDFRPAPPSIPVSAAAAQRPAAMRSTFETQLASRAKNLQGRRFAVVSGRVVGSQVSRGELPRFSMFDPGVHITTTAKVEVDQWLCGESEGKSLSVSYLGGALAGTVERNSSMPRDLRREETRVLVLEDFDGEWFLAAGLNDVLTMDPRGLLSFRDGSTTTVEKLSEACR